mmetsp:Transcript_8264/g.12931  ORF Transcript_8264/g.12931 Transcript_8264/m.12931 type:complete len:1078 (+) Transcript_8264:158-3391(+)
MAEEQKEEIDSVAGDAKPEEDVVVEDNDAAPRSNTKLKIGLLVAAVLVVITAAILIPVLVTKMNQGDDANAVSSSTSFQTSGDRQGPLDGFDWSVITLSPAPFYKDEGDGGSFSPISTPVPSTPAPSEMPFSENGHEEQEEGSGYYGGDDDLLVGDDDEGWRPIPISSPVSYRPNYYYNEENHHHQECYEVPDYGCSACGPGYCMTEKGNYIRNVGSLLPFLKDFIKEDMIECGLLEELALSGELNKYHGRKLEEEGVYYPHENEICEMLPRIVWNECGCNSRLSTYSPSPSYYGPTHSRPTYSRPTLQPSPKLPAGSNCTTSNECASYACALASVNATYNICCPNRYTYDIWDEKSRNYTSYCRRTADIDDSCLFDDQCFSGICINETSSITTNETRGIMTCRNERLNDREMCYSDQHCKSNYCGYNLYGPLQGQDRYCCAGRGYYLEYQYEYGYFCAGSIPEGEKCDSNRYGDVLCSTGICVNGVCSEERLSYGEECQLSSDCKTRACGTNSIEPSSSKMCCARTLWIYNSGYPRQEVCTGSLALDERCLINEQSYNDLCETGICVQGKCASERLDLGESCQASTDCKTGGCGSNSISIGYGDEDKVCCSNTLRVYNGYSSQDVCTRSLPLNETCLIGGRSYDALCETGICVHGKCAAERLDAGEACDENTDCANSRCAFSAYNRNDREKVCCRGNSIYIYDNFEGSNNYCSRSIDSGKECPSSQNNGYLLCKSGICLSGTCQDERLEDGSSCSFDNECDSGACALDVMDFGTRSMICCPVGQKLYMSDGFSSHSFCMRNTPIGGECNNDYNNGGDLCESGICVDGACASKRLNATESCESNNECKSGACGYNDLDYSSHEKVCCEKTCNIRVSDNYGYENYCTGILSMGDSCEWNTGRGLSKFPQLCPSGVCVDGVCSDELRTTGENCTHSSECTSGSCGFSSFQREDDSSPTCCGIGSYSIFDGVCDNDDYCQRSFEKGEQCSFRGSRYSRLCLSNFCTLEGVCGIRNETNSYYGEHGHGEAAEDEKPQGYYHGEEEDEVYPYTNSPHYYNDYPHKDEEDGDPFYNGDDDIDI